MLIQFVGTREQREMGTLFYMFLLKMPPGVSSFASSTSFKKMKKAHWPHNTYRMYSARTMIKKPMVHIWRPSRGPENYISWDMWLYHTPEIQERKRSHLLSYVKIKIKVVTEILMMWSLAPKKILDRKPFWAPTRLCQHTSCWTGCKLEVGEFSPLFHYMVY